MNISLGKTAQMAVADEARGTNGSAAMSAVTWSSTDPSIVVVDSTGLVSASAIGSASVIARSGASVDSVRVNVVSIAVANVNVSAPDNLKIGVGESYPLTVIAKDASGNSLSDRPTTWSSGNDGVATVSQAGLVTGVSPGSATITVSSEGVSDSKAVIVVPSRAPVASVTVAFGHVTLAPGQTPEVTVAPWQISDTAASAGGSVQVTVDVGDTLHAAAVARDASGAVLSGRNVIWSSLTPDVISVSSSGVVTALSSGTASLRASVETKSADATVGVVAPPVATVTVALASSTLMPGQTTQAVAVARDAKGALLTGRAVVWSSLNPGVAIISPAGVVTAIAQGTATIRATVESKIGDATLTVAAADVPPQSPATPIVPGDAELPRVYLSTSVASTPSAGRAIRVASGGDLQRAIDSTTPGDRILLECGGTYTGNYRLSAKSDGVAGGWITVQSECALPSEGTRTSPSQAFAKIVSPNVLPAITTNGAATRWRFVGVEITTGSDVANNQGLVALGCSNECESSTAAQPSDIIFDRVYVHGTSSVDVRRCFGFNGARLAVVDSYVSECHSGFDAQAVAGWNGPGPFKITNNYLEGAAEVVAFGGGDPSVPGLVPSDIEIRGNHITRPMAWKGGRWLIKNLIELKVGRRVLIDGNVLENSWPQGQAGFAFVLWSVNQQNTCPTCVTENVTIQNNVIRNVAAGFNLDATGGYTAIPMNHVVIRNNVIIGLDNSAVGGNGRLFQISNGIANLTIEHNTGFSPSNSSFIWAGNLPLTKHIVRNNLVGGGQYQLFTTWGQGQTAWDHAAGTGSSFAGNVVAAFTGGNMIAGNFSTGGVNDVGLVGGSVAYSVTATLDQFALASSSPFKGKATDGTDPGANIAAVVAATANVVQR